MMKMNRRGRALTRAVLARGVLIALGLGATKAGAEPSPAPEPGPAWVEFHASFLGGNHQHVSRFERGNPVTPGEYIVDVYVNERRVTRAQVLFRAPAADREVGPCFTRALLTTMGVDVARLDASGADLAAACIDLPAIIADARARFDNGQLRLDVSVPQVAMRRDARGYVDPILWDRGITAATIGYNFTASHANPDDGASHKQAYLGLNLGLNLGGWRIRNQLNFRWADDGGSDFQSLNTYAEHDVTSWRSQLTVGDAFTSGQLFDSVGFRGMRLATDTRMLPDAASSYAPIVRGSADTHARVEIRQKGYVIYETKVAPGAFEIDDLFVAGYGADLEVTVTEADGRQRTFIVPFAALPQLLRPGAWRYSATLGQLREDAFVSDAPYFAEGTYQRGLNNWATAYAGLQVAEGSLYRGLLVGAAFSTPLGGVAMDLIGSRAHLADRDTRDGVSARLTYSNSIPATNTNFALAAYRYSSRGFLSLDEAARWQDRLHSGQDAEPIGGQRSRLQLSLSQQLGDAAGSLSVSGSRSDYWDAQRPVDTSYQLFWANRFGAVSYGLGVERSRVFDAGGYDNRYFFSLSAPLGQASQRRAPQLSLGLTQAREQSSVRAGISGTAGEHHQYSYGIHGTVDDDRRDSVSLNAGWRGPYATMNGVYSQTDAGRQLSYVANGGVVLHGGGVTLAQQLSETIAVVEAKDAAGARLASSSVSKVDGRGYTIAHNLRPYRANDVTLDPRGTSMDVQLETSRLQTVPRAGAVVALKFETTHGRAVLIHGRLTGGAPLPFGAEVVDEQAREVGIVGQGGQALVRTLDDSGSTLRVRWAGRQCVLDYRPADLADTAGLTAVDSVCHLSESATND